MNKNLKKTLTIMTAGLALTACFTTAQAASLTDVQESDWYYTDVTAAVNNGAVNGYDDGSFRPSNTVKAGEAVKLTLGYKQIKVDNGYDHWASTWVTEASNRGILEYGDVEYYEEEMNRREIAKLVMRALNEEDVEFDGTIIPDYGLIPDEYKRYVAQAYAKGIITGYEGGAFIGDKAITRAEVVTILERAFHPEKRIALDVSKIDPNYVYERADIELRLNGIHYAYRHGQVVQYGNSICVLDCIDGERVTKYTPNYKDEKNTWTFENAFQVTNEVTAVKTGGVNEHFTYECIKDGGVRFKNHDLRDIVPLETFTARYGIPAEYDSDNRIIWLGEKEIKLYQTTCEWVPDEKHPWNHVPAEVRVRDTPIVSIAEDLHNCCMSNLGPVHERDIDDRILVVDGVVSSKEDIGYYASYELNAYTALILNVQGVNLLKNTDNYGPYYDLETGECLNPDYTHDMRSRIDLDVSHSNYIVQLQIPGSQPGFPFYHD